MLVFKAYWPSVRAHWHFFVGALFFIFLSVAANAARPFAYEGLTNVFGERELDENLAFRLMWLLALALFCNWLFWRCVDWCLALGESKVMRELEQRSFERLQMQSMSFHESAHTGSLVKQAAKFRDVFEGIADILCYQLVRDLMMVTIAFVTFYYKSAYFAWLFLGWVAAFLVLNGFVLWIKFPRDKAATKASSDVSSVLSDSLGAHLTVKAFGHEGNEQRRFNSTSNESERRRWKAWLTNLVCIALQSLLMAGFEVLLVHELIRAKKAGTANAGDFVFYQSAVATIFFLLWMFGHNMRMLVQHVADAREMAVIFAQEPEVKDVPNAETLTVDKGEIEFRGVIHSYNGNCRMHLDGVNLTIKPGESIAVVGPSGAGKTTLMKAVQRLFDPKEGAVFIDGINIAHVTQQSLRRHFALVPQMADLFNGTILANILFARPEATLDEVIDAAKRARIWDRICEMPEGLQQEVGERGMKLSGGERQRLAIARAILANRPFLLLDEATSSLDSETEHLVQEAIADLLKGKTSITIAHRLSTIQNADRIVVMDKGKIVQMGTHTQLLAEGGLYARLWSHQNGGYIRD